MRASYASRAVQRMVHCAHEVHAGVAFMVEADVQLYTRRAKHWEYDLGSCRVAIQGFGNVGSWVARGLDELGVKVVAVNTSNRKGKTKRTRNMVGTRASSKRAIVKLAEGDKIELFETR